MVDVHEERLSAAMLAGDVEELDRLLGAELAFVGPDGAVWTKDEDLDSHRTGRLRLQSLTTSERTRRALGEVMVIIVRAHLVGTFDDKPIDGYFRYTRVWRQIGEDWQIVAGHCSAIPA